MRDPLASLRRPRPSAGGAFVLAIVGLLLAAAASPAQTDLVPAGAVWRYLDDGSDQGAAWRDPAFLDRDWATGPAQLGYGDGDEATVVSFGPDPDLKHVTTWFRHTFVPATPPGSGALTLRLLRDDGAAVYLNGVEVARSNLPPGTVGYLTLATSAVGGDAEDLWNEFYLPASLLSAGANVLAVEVHQSSRTSSDLGFDLQLVQGGSLLRKQPYLVYPGDPTRMQVLWQAQVSGPGTIVWGPDESCSLGSAETTELDPDHRHAFTLSGLVPGERTWYRVTFAGESFTGSFRAAPGPQESRLAFFAYGDTRTYPATHDVVAASMASLVAANPDFRSLIVSVGDLVGDGDSEALWDQEFFGPGLPHLRALMADLPYQSAMGNHERSGVLFQEYFPYPVVAGRYWSFDYGPAHFVVMDQYTDYAPGSAQLAWIESDLAATRLPWRFLVLHEPGWSAGGSHANNVDVQQRLQPLCLQYDVRVVLGGHNHYYARAVVEGVHHVTTGGGGAPLYTPDPQYPYLVAAAAANHYCRIEIDGRRLRFLAVAGEAVLDSFRIELPTDVGPEPPGALALHAATPNPGSASPGRPTRFSFSLPAAAGAELAIFDLSGRLVRKVVAGTFEAGAHESAWDGLDAAGRPAPAGTYVVRLQAGGETRTQKIVLTR